MYAPKQPLDKNGVAIQGIPPAAVALARTVGTPTASSVISFNANTTEIEVAATGSFGNGLAIKWGSASVITAAGTANFDNIVPAGTVRRFVVPRSTIGGGESVVGANALNGLYSTVSVINQAASVMSSITEY